MSEFEEEQVGLLPAAILVITVRAIQLRHRGAQSNVGLLQPQVTQVINVFDFSEQLLFLKDDLYNGFG